MTGEMAKNVGEGARGRGPLPPPPNPFPQSLEGAVKGQEKACLKALSSPAPRSGLGGRCGGRAGTSGPWPSPHHPLSRLSLQPGRAALVWGEPFRSLAAAAAAWGAARGGRVLVVDAANAFDPYRLVREARLRGLPRALVLSRVRVARAFTSHQLVRLLAENLPGELAPGSLVLVLGPVSLFYDEQIPLAERRRLFAALVDTLAAYKAQAPLLLLQPPLPRGAPNRHFGARLAPLVDYLVRVEASGGQQGQTGGRQGGHSPLTGRGQQLHLSPAARGGAGAGLR